MREEGIVEDPFGSTDEETFDRIVNFLNKFAEEHPGLAQYYEERISFWKQVIAFLRWRVTTGGLTDGESQLIEAKILAAEQALATRDGLTGAWIKTAWKEEFERAHKNCQRYRLPLSLLVVDINDFKAINDQWGHDYGDVALRRVAISIQKSVREGDFVGRWGGDEFVVGIVSDLGGAQLVAHRIKDSLDDLSVSIGVGEMNLAQKEDFDALFKRVDRAMYQAKRQKKEKIGESVVVISAFGKGPD